MQKKGCVNKAVVAAKLERLERIATMEKSKFDDFNAIFRTFFDEINVFSHDYIKNLQRNISNHQNTHKIH